MAIAAGTQLGTYEVLSAIGAGGMGEVYRARDTKLKRDVAVKVLPDEFSRDPDRVHRFQREAEALAALNHSNIAAIYDVQEVNDVRFLILELVEGDTLAGRLKRGAMVLDEALPIAKQICDALAAAHEKGIIHRDLKPANIKITSDGKVKLLDFGLARLFERDLDEADSSNSPTVVGRTSGGVILGTASYMSPEQARGHRAGKQADIWAFGCVVYEMLSGKLAFAGNTTTDILSNVIKSDPDWTSLPPTVPSNIVRLLRRSLQKDLQYRLHDIADARIELDDEAARDTASSARRPPAAKRAWIAAAMMSLAFVAAVSVAVTLYIGRPERPSEQRLQIITPATDEVMSFAISPDGRRLVFRAYSKEGKAQLWMRQLDSAVAQPISGTEGAIAPFWSPDGRSIAFFAQNKLKRIDINGGAVRVLASVTLGRGGTWNRDDVIVFAPGPSSPLYKISAAGGAEATPITSIEIPRQSGHRFPHFLPDGRHFLFNTLGNSAGRGVYLGSLDSPKVQRLFDSESQAAFIPPGYVIFVRQGILLAQGFDLKGYQLSGDPIAIAENVGSDSTVLNAAFSFGGGILGYRAGVTAAARQFTWFDRSGKSISTVGLPDRFNPANPNISPDGEYIAFDRQAEGNTDVWLLETARGVSTRFTVNDASDRIPIWSPDGKKIVFGSNRAGVQNLYERSTAGGAEQLLRSSNAAEASSDWSADGRFIMYRDIDSNTGYDLWAVPTSGDRKPIPIAITSFEERDGQFSPDGRWVAFRSDETGRFEVYIQPFPGTEGKIQISTEGGSQPRWRHDGKELFYISPDYKLMAVPIVSSPDGKTIKRGVPTALFAVQIAGGPTPGTNNQQYAVSGAGQKFLVNVASDETSTPITVVLNWNPQSKK